MILDNSRGQYHSLRQNYALDGRDQEVRLGGPDTPFEDWFTVFKGTSSGFHPGARELRIGLTDYGYKLDEPLSQRTYAGTGGLEGGSDLKGKRLPRSFGFPQNVTPVLVIASELLFQVNDGEVVDIPDVYANGVALTQSTNHATSDLLRAASITSGHYHTCFAEGLYRINFSLDGTLITNDVLTDVLTVPDIIRAMALERLPADGIYEPGFTKYEAGGNYEASYYTNQDAGISTRQAIAELLGVGSYACFTLTGKLNIIRLGVPASPPILRITDTMHKGIDSDPLNGDMRIPPSEWLVGWGKNWTPMSGVSVAGSVSADRRTWLSEAVRFAVAKDDAIKTAHPFSRPHTAGGLLRYEVDAQTEAERFLALHRRQTALYRIPLHLEGFGIDHGDIIHVQSRDCGLDDGKYMMVIGRGLNAKDLSSEVVGFAP